MPIQAILSTGQIKNYKSFEHLKKNLHKIKELHYYDLLCDYDEENDSVDTSNGLFLAEALKTNESIVKLNLSECNIIKEVAQAIAEALKVNKTLKHLNLFMNNMDNEGVSAILDALLHNQTLETLEIPETCDIDEEVATKLATLISVNKSIKSLDISDNNFTEKKLNIKIIESLSKNNTLERIDLSRYKLTEEAVDKLTNFLKTNTVLRSLNISDTVISATGLKQIAGALKHNKTLKSISLGGIKLTNEALGHFVNVLRENSTLEDIDLCECDLDDESLTIIADLLRNRAATKTLNIGRNNDITHKGMLSLSQALSQNNNLKELILTLADDSSIREIANALKNNRRLKSLYISSSKLTNTGLQYLADALKENSSLEYISLGSCNITSEGAIIIASALAVNKGLKKINLSHNKIGYEGAKHIAEALKQNPRITKVNFDYNNPDNKEIPNHPETINSGNYRETMEIFKKYTDDCKNLITEVLVNNKKRIAASLVQLYYNCGKDICATKLLELAYNYYSKVILEGVMDCLGEKSPDNAIHILKEIKKMYLRAARLSKQNGTGQFFPDDVLNEIASYALPQFKETFRLVEQRRKQPSRKCKSSENTLN